MKAFEGLARPVVVGHRGGRGAGFPAENSIAAFMRAKEQGADAVETDVRVSASGEAVLFHDPTLERMTGGKDKRPVAQVPWWELSRVPIGKGERIASLADLLGWAHHKGMALNVEIKHDVPDRLGVARAVARSVVSCRVPLVVSSFDPLTLAAFGAFAPRVPRALLTDVAQRYAPALRRAATVAARAGAVSALHVHEEEAKPASVAAWKAAGLAVGVWTVNDAARARELVASGVDFLITDRPAEIREALGLPKPAP
jgi:glycerophosphoryl diester phosphodiesterase